MIQGEVQVLANSLWTATAGPAPDFPTLTGEVEADVAIIGAGVTGLSAALHLAEAGMRPVVLEARTPGWGASGRNGGQLNPGLKGDPDEVTICALREADKKYRVPFVSVRAADNVPAQTERVLEDVMFQCGVSGPFLTQCGGMVGVTVGVGFDGKVMRFGAFERLSAWRSVLSTMNSMFSMLAEIILFTAFDPPPPQPMTTTCRNASARAPSTGAASRGWRWWRAIAART